MLSRLPKTLFLNQVILGLLPRDAVLPIGVLLEILGLAPIHASFQIPLVSGGVKALTFLPSIYLIHFCKFPIDRVILFLAWGQLFQILLSLYFQVILHVLSEVV